MRWQIPLGAAFVILLVPATGFGWFHSLFSRSSAAPAMVYYCPVPVVIVAPTVPLVPIGGVPAIPPAPIGGVPPAGFPAVPPPGYARPRPAPPSGSTPEPPRAPDTMPKAGVNAQESRKADERFFDSYFVAGTAPAARDHCAVIFWNLSARDVELTVAGQARPLPAGKNLRLDLTRDFAWNAAGHQAERQQVPIQEAGVEIVIRR